MADMRQVRPTGTRTWVKRRYSARKGTNLRFVGCLDRGGVHTGHNGAGVDGLALREEVRGLLVGRLLLLHPLEGRRLGRGAVVDSHRSG